MNNNYTPQEGEINIWISLADVVLGFMIIIFLLFVLNTIRLERYAQFTQRAIEDREILVRSVVNAELEEFVAEDSTLIRLPAYAVWDFEQTSWGHINREYQDKIEKFGETLKTFMDGEVLVFGKKRPRYEVYSIIIIGHACAYGDDFINYNISRNRAETIRDRFQTGIFKDEVLYKIYAAGAGKKHPYYIDNPFSKLNRRVEVKIQPEFLGFSEWER